MAENSKIGWTDYTASPWFGCTEWSPGCLNCYARELTLQKKWAGWGDNAPRVRSKGFWKNAYTWNRKAEGAPRRPRIFTSLMDWLDEKAPIEWLVDFLKVVHDCQNLDWLLLTKRAEQIYWEERMTLAVGNDLRREAHGSIFNGWLARWANGNPPANVWYGVTVENQFLADDRIPELLKIPAKVRWLSVEPLLERIDLKQSMPCGYYCSLQSGHVDHSIKGIDWIVVGGESGPKRRDCGIDAIVNVCEQAIAAGVPLYVKQDCALKSGVQGRIPDHLWQRKEFPSGNL